ncbi:MAG: hypothetical protein AB1486_04725 [Planctomycetota bacterium]
MASYLGLEVGDTHLCAVQLEGSAKRPVVRAFDCVELDSTVVDDPGRLGDFLRQGRFSREPSAVALDSRSCVFREIDLPFTGDEQIRKVIKYEVEGHLPQSDVGEMVVAYKRLGQHRDKSRLMVMAVPKRAVLDRLAATQAAGVDPLHVELDLTALYNALSGLGYTTDHGVFALVQCGARATNVLLIEKGELIAARSVRLGYRPETSGPKSTEAGARGGERGGTEESALSPSGGPAALRASAPEGRASPGEGAAADDELVVLADGSDESGAGSGGALDGLAQPQAGYLSRLDREIRRTLGPLRLTGPIEVVYLTGSGAALEGIGPALGRAFGCECRPWNPLERVEHKLDEEKAALAQREIGGALGAALKLAGHDATGVDLRQEECAYTRKFDQIKVPLTCLAMMVLILVLLVDIYHYSLYRKNRQEMRSLAEGVLVNYEQWHDLEAQPNAKLGAELQGADLVARALRNLTDREKELRVQLGRSGAFKGLPSALEAWAYLANAIDQEKEAIGPFVMEKLDITTPAGERRQASATLSGILTSSDAYARLEDALKRHGKIVTQVKPATLAPTPDKRLKFDRLEIEINKEAVIH